MKSVNFLSVIYISFYSLTSRTRNGTVELADGKENECCKKLTMQP